MDDNPVVDYRSKDRIRLIDNRVHNSRFKHGRYRLSERAVIKVSGGVEIRRLAVRDREEPCRRKIG